MATNKTTSMAEPEDSVDVSGKPAVTATTFVMLTSTDTADAAGVCDLDGECY